MRTARRIDAIFRQHQALDRLSVHDVRFDDLLDVVRRDAPVPDGIGIHHHRRSVFTLIEAARHIGAHAFLESAQRKFLFEEELQLGLTGRITAAALVPGLPLVAADEQMLFKLGHALNFTGFGLGRRTKHGQRTG